MRAVPSIVLAGVCLEWRLRERMGVAGISSARALHRRLKELDPDAVEFSRFAEVVDEMPRRMSVRMLLGLAVALDCGIEDLLVLRKDTGEPTERRLP